MKLRFCNSCRIGVVFTALFISILVGCKPAGVAVTVTNATGGEITGLEVRFKGGSKSAQKLKAAESFEATINPHGESHLVIAFVDSSGKRHSAEVDVYFERGYKGGIHVTIRPDGTVTWKEDIKV